MFVEEWMNKDVCVVEPSVSFQEAWTALNCHDTNYLCIVDCEDLIGIMSISDFHIYLSEFDENGNRSFKINPEMKIGEVMVKNPITITQDSTIEEAAQLMSSHKIGCLPVIKKAELQGIITETDILEAFIDIMETLRRKGLVSEVTAPLKYLDT